MIIGAPRDWVPTAPQPNFGSKPPVGNSPDLMRVLMLDRRLPPEGVSAAALVEMMTARYRRDNANCTCQAEFSRECITRLRFIQAWALYEIGLANGLLGPIGVGHGKTILDLLSVFAVKGAVNAVLLVPPNLVDQLIRDYQLVGQHFHMPQLIVHGRDWSSTMHPGRPVLHVYPYSLLMRAPATDFLSSLKPDVVIADEVHKLRDADTATTSRVLRYFRDYPSTRFCGWSGSLTNASVRDYAHLAMLALRGSSPLPIDPEVAKDWGRAIDAQEWPAPPGALSRLCEGDEPVRSGFHRRLVETQGVVHTKEAPIDVALVIEERPIEGLPLEVESALKEVRLGTRPDGEEFLDELSKSRCACQVASGFYYRWKFTKGEPRALIDEWVMLRKAWRKELRTKLKDRSEHLDSPLLCQKAAMRAWGDVGAVVDLEDGELPSPWTTDESKFPQWKAKTWPAWRDIRHKVKPITVPVRLHPFLAEDTANWAIGHRGVVWYAHSAFGAWVAEISGLPMHGGGPDAGAKILAERGNHSIIASIKSHGTGRDGLQHYFYEQLVANPPANGAGWEQLLGRLHRIGQNASEVRTEFYRHTPEIRKHVDQAVLQAVYVLGTLGSTQKLTVGWNLVDEP